MSTRVISSALTLAAVLGVAGCAGTRKATSPTDDVAVEARAVDGEDDGRASAPVVVLLVVPDIVGNTVLYAVNPLASVLSGSEVSNLWPLVTLTSPIVGPVAGVRDALYGYGPWDPVALDEHRRYGAGR